MRAAQHSIRRECPSSGPFPFARLGLLEHVLRQIKANHANLRHGRSPLLMRINTISLALMMPSGAVHPIIPGPAIAGARNP